MAFTTAAEMRHNASNLPSRTLTSCSFGRGVTLADVNEQCEQDVTVKCELTMLQQLSIKTHNSDVSKTKT